jgi:DNA-directed RNA polymerase subunit L
MVFSNTVEDATFNKLSVDIEDVDVSFVNALRRIIISEVPTAAFDEHITFNRNTGSLHNEFLSHRLSLIPLRFTWDEIDNFVPTKYNFSLKVKNQTDGMITVTTKDFIISDDTGKVYPQEFHRRMFPANPVTGDHILITKLKPNLFDKTKGDEIDIVAMASIGVGKVNAKWSPVSQCSYWNIVDDEAAEQGLADYVKKHEATGMSAAELHSRFNTLEVFRCYKKNQYDEPCAFRFELQSECQLDPRFIIKKALSIMQDKITTLNTNIIDNNQEAVAITQENGMTFLTIEKEDHTLGNLVQALLYNHFKRGNEHEDANELLYIGYYKPHPLEDNVVLKLRTKTKDAIKVVSSGLAAISTYIKDIAAEWH